MIIINCVRFNNTRFAIKKQNKKKTSWIAKYFRKIIFCQNRKNIGKMFSVFPGIVHQLVQQIPVIKFFNENVSILIKMRIESATEFPAKTNKKKLFLPELLT